MAGSFLENFAKDIEVIHAKYSKTIDGDAELLLSSCDLPEFVKVLDNPTFAEWQKSSSPLPRSDDRLTFVSSTSSDDESDMCDTAGVRQTGIKNSYISHNQTIEEDSTSSSSSSDSGNMSGWDSDCSGPITATSLTHKTKRRPKRKNPSKEILPLAAVLPVENPQGEDLSGSKYFSHESGVNGDIVCNKSAYPDLLKAIQEFRKTFFKSGIGKSRKRPKRSPLLASPHGNASEFRKIANFGNQKSKSGILARNSPPGAWVTEVEPGCAFEKLFVRKKGSSIHDMIEIANRNSYVINGSKNLQHQNLPLAHPASEKFMLRKRENALDMVKQPVLSPRSVLPHSQETSILCDSRILEPKLDNGLRFPHHSTPLKSYGFPSCSDSEPPLPTSDEERTPRFSNKADAKARIKRCLRRRSMQSQSLQKETKGICSVPSPLSITKGQGRINGEPGEPWSVCDESDLVDSYQHSVLLQATPGHTSMCLGDAPPYQNTRRSGNNAAGSSTRKTIVNCNSENTPKQASAHVDKVIEEGSILLEVTPGHTSMCLDDPSAQASATGGGRMVSVTSDSGKVAASHQRSTKRKGLGSTHSRHRSVSLQASPGHTSMWLSDTSDHPYQNSEQGGCTMAPRKVQVTPDSRAASKPASAPRPAVQIRRHTEGGSTPKNDNQRSWSVTREIRSLERLVGGKASASSMRMSSDSSKGEQTPSRRRLYTSRNQHRRQSSTEETIDSECSKADECSRTLGSPINADARKSCRFPYERYPSFKVDNWQGTASLKAKTTPRRRSTGYHPYCSSPVQNKSPSLCSPLHGLTLRSPTTQDVHARRIKRDNAQKQGKIPITVTPIKPNLPTPQKRRTSKEQPGKGLAFGKVSKNVADVTHSDEVTEDCSTGNCTKKFCFNCSMDCS